MKIRQAVYSVFLLGFLFLAAPAPKGIAQPVSGDSSCVLLIRSLRDCSFEEQQDEVCLELETVINSGLYNIVSVDTTYSSGYLTAAKVVYDAFGPGDGNKLRLLFIHGNNQDWSAKDAYLKSRLAEVVNSGEYNIARIKTTYAKNYLIAAEVYYQEQ